MVFLFFFILFMCMAPVDLAVPPVLNSGRGNAWFNTRERLRMDFIWLSVAGNQVKAQKNLAKAGSS